MMRVRFDRKFTISSRAVAGIFALATILGGAAAQTRPSELVVTNAWARQPLAPQNNSAVYLSLENTTSTPRAVVSVTAQVAEKAEMHETSMEGGLMKMTPVKEIVVPAKGKVEFTPGGYHIMLFGVKKPLKPGDVVNLTLKLDDHASIPVAATVRGNDAGANMPPSSGHGAMPMPGAGR